MTNLAATGFHPIYRDRLLQEQVYDTYKIKGKLHDPTVCPTCKAVFHQGRWQWLPQPAVAIKHSCPACMRIHDHYPAGYVAISGPFYEEHRDEILQVALNVEKYEREKDPLKRIMATEKESGKALVTTTDIQLARMIGEAIHQVYQGELEFQFSPRRRLLRVNWKR